MVAEPETEHNYQEDESTDDLVLELSPLNDSSLTKNTSRGGGRGGTNQETSDASLWLVKSGERILGPFRTEEVIEKVRSRELVVIDEIAAPSARWRYLRDEPSFALVVEETRRAQMVNREDTEVQMGGGEIVSANSGSHHLLAPANLSSQGAQIGLQSETFSGTSPHDESHTVKDGEFTEEVLRPGSATKPEENVAGRQFGVSQSQAIATALERRSRLLWLLTLLIVVGAGAYLFRGSPPPTAPKAVDNSETFKQALFEGEQAWNHGDLDKALASYRHADELIPGNPDVTVRLATLMMKVEGETVAAKRSLQDLLARTADARLQKEAQLGLGLAALFGEDFKEADKIYQALAIGNPADPVIRYNIGVGDYLKGDYKAAALELTETLRISQDLAPASILLAMSYLHQGGDNLKNASEVLESYLTSHFDYRQEAQILQTEVTLMRGNHMQALASAGMALETDPYLTDEHLHDVWLDLDPLNANKLLAYVQKIHAELGSPTTQALLAIYQAKAKQSGDAEKTVADGLAAKPGNSDLLSANAFVLMQTGRDADAKAVLSVARKDDAKLAWILTGRNCQRLHEEECENQAWDKLVKYNPPELVALIGHANEVQAATGKKTPEAPQAEQDLVKAESLSPHYLPAIRMREAVSGQ